MDGLDDNDQVNGYAFTGVLRETQDSVEEFRVTTGLADADQGRSSGAQVSMVTKSGTNKFHGAAYEYNRPTLTVANDWFNKAAQVGSGEPNVPPKLIRNNFGGARRRPNLQGQALLLWELRRPASGREPDRQPDRSHRQLSAGNHHLSGRHQRPETSRPPPSQPARLQPLTAGCTAQRSLPLGSGSQSQRAGLPEPVSGGQRYARWATVYNTGSFTFSSPNPVTLNTSIARIDFTPDQKHRIFVRGNLQKDTTAGTEQFPGQGPSYNLIDNTKGIAAGYTWTISSNLVNDVRYGYIRQGYSQRGPGTGDYVDFRFMATLTSENRSTIVSVPVNNIIDNLSWNKGKHSLQFGGNWRLVHQNRGTDGYSLITPPPRIRIGWAELLPTPQPLAACR